MRSSGPYPGSIQVKPRASEDSLLHFWGPFGAPCKDWPHASRSPNLLHWAAKTKSRVSKRVTPVCRDGELLKPPPFLWCNCYGSWLPLLSDNKLIKVWPFCRTHPWGLILGNPRDAPSVSLPAWVQLSIHVHFRCHRTCTSLAGAKTITRPLQKRSSGWLAGLRQPMIHASQPTTAPLQATTNCAERGASVNHANKTHVCFKHSTTFLKPITTIPVQDRNCYFLRSPWYDKQYRDQKEREKKKKQTKKLALLTFFFFAT